MYSFEGFAQLLLDRLEERPDIKYTILDGRFRRELSAVASPTAWLRFLRSEAATVFELAGRELPEFLGRNFNEEQLLQERILINPETIPQTGYMDLTVFFTEPCEITVAHPATMYVYGDVKLTMRQGKAHVYTTKFVSEAYGDSFMYMYNLTSAVAHDRATVYLDDRARCLARDHSRIKAWGSAFVEARDESDVAMLGYGQLLITSGCPHVELEDYSRGYILLTEPVKKPLRVTLVGQSLLYASVTRAQDLILTPYHYYGTIIRGEEHDSDLRQAMKERIVPQYAHAFVEEKPLMRALDLSVIVDDLRRFLPEPSSDTGIVLNERCFNFPDYELLLCAWVARHFEELARRGLDGRFLRTHFTPETLEANGLFAFAQQHSWECRLPMNEWRFFSDQYITNLEDHQLRERAVGTMGSFTLHDRATAILVDKQSCTALDHAAVIGLDKSNVTLRDGSSAKLYDTATANAEGQAKLWLHGHNKAHVSGHCVVLTEGKSSIVQKDTSKGSDNTVVVGEVTDKGTSATVKESPTMSVVKLSDKAQYQQFIKTYMTDDRKD